MAVTSFQDFNLADADREWDGDAADKRIRTMGRCGRQPNQKYRDAHVWYDARQQGQLHGVQVAHLRCRR